MLGIMKDKRQLLKENTHSSKDTEEQTTSSLKHNWKVAYSLYSTCFPKLGVAWETAAHFTFLLLSVLKKMKVFSHPKSFLNLRDRKKHNNNKKWSTVLQQLFLHCFGDGSIRIQSSPVVTDPSWRIEYIPARHSVLLTSPFGRCWKLVIRYIPKILLNRRKQSKSSKFSQDGKAISSSSWKNGGDWKVSGKVIMPLWWVHQEAKTGSLAWINIFIFDLTVCVNLTKRNHQLNVPSVYTPMCDAD